MTCRTIPQTSCIFMQSVINCLYLLGPRRLSCLYNYCMSHLYPIPTTMVAGMLCGDSSTVLLKEDKTKDDTLVYLILTCDKLL